MGSLIADKIMEQMQRIGQPKTSTSTTTQEMPGEGLDLGSLMSLLFLSGMFNKGGTSTSLGTTGLPANTGSALNQAMGTGVSGMGSIAPTSLSGQSFDTSAIIKALLGMK